MTLAGCCALMLGWRLTDAEAHLGRTGLLGLDPVRAVQLQDRAFAEGEVQPGLTHPQNVKVEIQGGETLEAAIRRIGVAAEEAQRVAELLNGAFDPVNVKKGFGFTAAVAGADDDRGPVRLLGLSMRTGPASVITISRTFDGALRMRQLTEKILDETTIARGDIEGSFYEAAAAQGSTPSLTHNATKLFSHKIDFTRDIREGDPYTLVFTRKVTESGRTVEGGDLLYAELAPRRLEGKSLRFYRFEPADGGEAQFYDETGANIRGFLLATPLAVARVTSNFGFRRHPILGYNKMHQGTDFAARAGTPIYAAGDGVVVKAGRNGGYGNWVQIKHDGVWQTGYAHMSRFAPGMRSGIRVKQGQLIGYVGSTGQSTGPHLHYEVMKNGVKVNPKGAKVPGGSVLTGAQLAAFKSQKATIDATLAQAPDMGQTRLVKNEIGPEPGVAPDLRPTQVASR